MNFVERGASALFPTRRTRSRSQAGSSSNRALKSESNLLPRVQLLKLQRTDTFRRVIRGL